MLLKKAIGELKNAVTTPQKKNFKQMIKATHCKNERHQKLLSNSK
jgi:hypothetical protein